MKDVSDLKEVPNEGAGAVLVWVHWGRPFDDELILKLASWEGYFIKNLLVIIVGSVESFFPKTCMCFPVATADWCQPCQFRHLGESWVWLGIREQKITLDEIGLLSSMITAHWLLLLEIQRHGNITPFSPLCNLTVLLLWSERTGKELGGLGLNTFFQGLGYPVPASPG